MYTEVRNWLKYYSIAGTLVQCPMCGPQSILCGTKIIQIQLKFLTMDHFMW